MLAISVALLLLGRCKADLDRQDTHAGQASHYRSLRQDPSFPGVAMSVPDPTENCTTYFSPVCDSTGARHLNQCFAKALNATVTQDTSCVDGKPPPQSVVQEVQLHLGGTGSGTAQPAPSPQTPCPCPKIYRQVCGSDGVTYDNACLAACAGAVIVADGACPTSGALPASGGGFVCTAVYSPVCGKDGVTYSNQCAAEKGAGAKVAHSGAC